ncbi:MAG TPA: hypothetical protein VIK86_01615 [Candidatus Paceibacterota bacterium]
MALIPLKEYAKRHGRNPATVRQKANRGGFETVQKIGRDWFIDEEEPYEDNRETTGKFKNWRKRRIKMNDVVKEAKEIDQFGQYLPELEIGEQVEMNDVWDGKGETPDDSYSYFLGENECSAPVWINYTFDIIDEKENPLDTVIIITDIELL